MLLRRTSSILSILSTPSLTSPASRRLYGMIDKRGVVKRVYRNVEYSKGNDGYSVLLDGKPLKTPKGQPLLLPTERLAAVISQEWAQQEEEIRPHSMHLNSLAHTAIDNPISETNEQRVESILQTLSGDPVCLRISEPEEFFVMQNEKWGPLLEWFNTLYGVSIKPEIDGFFIDVTEDSLAIVRKKLSRHDKWHLTGLKFGVDSCRSLIIMSSLLEGVITCEEAVFSSLLESQFQVRKWGRVEWGHDVEEAELWNRLSAAVLFVTAASE
ncbi:ATP synthase mitochondrial F1 complex assembly factor 2-like [Oopsacas minuta]|uniref:ATP synthase mitochondrial F1 complex assembly factor 2-like n=1 Tax=Oopsacas minuta TaxID=111878 RepID=A0AAV7JAY7_9METZ|nr:ATP synthase mitochondrial F1 complex assembly factor 2-like [Oopsacas minuta]